MLPLSQDLHCWGRIFCLENRRPLPFAQGSLLKLVQRFRGDATRLGKCLVVEVVWTMAIRARRSIGVGGP
jgi:hypothetical protein